MALQENTMLISAFVLLASGIIFAQGFLKFDVCENTSQTHS
jgi:hypothetical protein